MEVVAGARSEQRGRDLRRLLGRCVLLSFDGASDFDGAVRVHRACRSAGVTPRGLVDCMIAAVALREGASLLAHDADLARVAAVFDLSLDSASLSVQRVGDAGTICRWRTINVRSCPIEVFWSDDDQAWIADVPDLTYCSAHGSTPHEAVAEVEAVIQAWLDAADAAGRPVPIYLDERQAEELDRRAAAAGVSRSELIRRLVSRAMEGDADDAEADLAAIEGSHGALRDVEPSSRGDDERAAHLDSVWRLGA